MPKVRKNRRLQRGATLVTTALMATGLVVFAGLVADTGGMLHQRTRMQVAADAAALAGARALPQGSSYAISQAKDVAQKNGFALGDSGIRIEQGARMTVTLDAPAPSVVGQILLAMQNQKSAGLAVGARAVADLQASAGKPGIRPFGVPHCAFIVGGEYVLKDGPPGSYRGHFQALAVDGRGANLYRSAILSGATRPVSVGEKVEIEPGAMTGPTVQGINQLIGNDMTSFQSAQRGAATPRVIIVPLIGDDYFVTDGRSQLSVVGFARFYLTYTTQRGEVYGRFIDQLGPGDVAGTAPKYTVRLVDEHQPLPPAFHPVS